MKKIEVYFTQWLFLMAAISFWGVLAFTAIEFFGIEDDQGFEDLSFPGVLILLLFITTFVSSILAANLFSYIFIARILKVSRAEMEKIISDHAKSDSRENIEIVQRFYRWCLDVAYTKKT